MSALPPGAIPIDHPAWNRRLQDWGYHTGEIFNPMSGLVGRVVNIGTKDGVVYDTALVLAFRDTGLLVLDGGRKQTALGGAADMDGAEDIHCNDIARGYVHPDGPAPAKPGILPAALRKIADVTSKIDLGGLADPYGNALARRPDGPR